MGCMIVDPSQQFDFLAPIATVQRVIHDEHIGSILRGQWLHPCDDRLCEQEKKSTPVIARSVQEAMDGVLSKP